MDEIFCESLKARKATGLVQPLKSRRIYTSIQCITIELASYFIWKQGQGSRFNEDLDRMATLIPHPLCL